jgi:DNA-binding NarL/FixJ family response regulator
MAARKKAGRRGEGDSTAGQIRALLAEGKSPKDIAEQLGTSTAYVYVVKSEGNKKAGGSKPRAKPAEKAVRAPRGASSASSLAEMLSDPGQVQAARQLIEQQIKELEAQIASKRATLKILSAAGG